jgi:hypothetical protein
LWAGEYLCEEGDKEGVREKKIFKNGEKNDWDSQNR